MPWAGSPEPSPSPFTTCPGRTGLIPLVSISVPRNGGGSKFVAFTKQIYQPHSNDIQSHGNRNLLLTPKFEQQQGRRESFCTYLSHLATRALQLGAAQQKILTLGGARMSDTSKRPKRKYKKNKKEPRVHFLSTSASVCVCVS